MPQRFGRLVQMVAAAIGALGLVATTVQNMVNVHRLLDERFWWVLGAAAILGVAALWPKPPPRAVGFRPDGAPRPGLVAVFKPYRWVLLLVVITMVVGGWRLWEQRRSVTDTEPVFDPTIPIGLAPPPVRIEHAVFSPGGGGGPMMPQARLVSFGLDERKTSYIKAIEERSFSYQASPGADELTYLNLTTYRLPNELLDYDRFERATEEVFEWYDREPDAETVRPTVYEHQLTLALAPRCARSAGPAMVRRALARFATDHDRRHLLRYIETDALVSSLPTRRRDVLRELLPKGAEWGALRQKNAADYGAILDWVRECVGIPFPVFTVALENTSIRPLVVTGVSYHVIDVYRILAAEESPSVLEPSYTYVHRIEPLTNTVPIERWIPYRAVDPLVGRYLAAGNRATLDFADGTAKGLVPPPLQYDLSPPFAIDPRSAGSFNLQLYLGGAPNAGSAEHDLLMSVEFHTNMGSLRTSEFVLVAVPLDEG